MSNLHHKLAEKEPNSSEDEESVVEVKKYPPPKLNFMQNKPDVYITKEALGYRENRLVRGEEGLYVPGKDL